MNLLADHMNMLGNNMNTSEGEVLEVIRRVGSLGAVAGINAKEIASLGAAMIDTGAQAETAGTAIRNMILNTTGLLTKTSKGGFKHLGIDPGKFKLDVQKKGIKAYVKMFEKIRALPIEQQASTMQAMFGKRAIDALAPLINNLSRLHYALGLTEDDMKSMGAVDREFATRMEAFDSVATLYKNKIQNTMIRLGEAMSKPLTKAMSFTSPYIDKIKKWITENDELVGSTASVTAGFVALNVALAATKYMWAFMKYGTFSTVAKGLGLVAAAFSLPGFLTVAAIAAAITALVVAFKFISNNAEGISAFFSGFAEEFSKGFGPMPEVLKPLVTAFSDLWKWLDDITTVDLSLDEWKAWGKYLGGGAAQAVNFVADAVKALVDWLGKGLRAYQALAAAINNARPAPGAKIAEPKPGFNPRGRRLNKAGGGAVYGGSSYMVGENGPEIFHPQSKGSIQPNSGGGGAVINMPINVTMNGGGDGAVMIEQLRDVMRDEVRESFRGILGDTGIRFA